MRGRYENGGRRPLDILDSTGGGVAWLDYDRDGDVDLFCTGGRAENALFRNKGDGTFEDVSGAAGIAAPGRYSMGCAVADYDGSGFPDILVTCYGANALYRNRGDGTFQEVAARTGVAGAPVGGFPKWSLSAAWFDADADDDLDLYVTNYIGFGPGSRRLCDSGPVQASCPQLHYPAQPHLFYRNQGNGRFEEATGAAGFAVAAPGRGMAVLPFHPEPAGPIALYVCNDGTPNFLFVKGPDGRYRDVGFQSGCAVSGSGSEQASMGVDAADVDGDGRLDLAATSFQHDSNTVYRNRGKLDFVDASSEVGISVATWNFLAFGCNFWDADLDGDVDLLFANGHVWDNAAEADRSATYAQTAQLFVNTSGRFADVSAGGGPALGQPLVGRGTAVADYDNDGDLDVAVAVNGGAVQLWKNESPPAHWLQIRLEGRPPNVEALGARVTLHAGGRPQTAEVLSGRSYLSDSERRLTFGLGSAPRVERVTVTWPDGSVTEQLDLPADQALALTQPAERRR